MVEIMRILAARTSPPPSDGEIIDGWDEDYWDIDRWETDGGNSPGATLR